MRGEGDARDKSVYPCDDKGGRLSWMGPCRRADGCGAGLFFMFEADIHVQGLRLVYSLCLKVFFN